MNEIFDGTEWVTYKKAVNDVTEKEDCYTLLYSLLEEAKEQPTDELILAIKVLMAKMGY